MVSRVGGAFTRKHSVTPTGRVVVTCSDRAVIVGRSGFIISHTIFAGAIFARRSPFLAHCLGRKRDDNNA